MSPIPPSLWGISVQYHPSSPARSLQATRKRTYSGYHLLSIYRIHVKCYAKHFIDTVWFNLRPFA